MQVKVPRVVSCLCTPEPYDDNGKSISLRFSECSIEPLLPTRRTPELSYLCAKHGASVSYREAARSVADLAGLAKLSHTTVRKDTVQCGEYVENKQFRIGWLAGGRKRNSASHLRIAIDGTALSAKQFQEVRKFEVLGGFYRRLSARIGNAKAITATARKIAVLFYNTLRYRMQYVDPGAAYYEERYRQRVLNNLTRRAESPGYILQAKPA